MKTLLIVEHNKKERQELRRMIQGSKIAIHTILECASGEEALHLLKTQKVEVMFTNLELPGLDGLTLITEACRLEQEPKIVVVSSLDEFSSTVKLLRLGVREYLLKPAQRTAVEEILDTLNAEIEQSLEKEAAKSTIQGQHLKQLVMNMNAPAGELESLRVQIDSKLFQGDYLVCCLDNMGLDSYMWDDRGYVGNVGQGELFIVKPSVLEQIRLQEWRRRFVGVSKVHQGIEDFQSAYMEAYEARIEAFYRERPLVRAERIESAKRASDSEKSAKGSTEQKRAQVATLVQKIGTTKANQVLKEVGKILWQNKREKDMKALQILVEDFFTQIESTYSSMSAADEYEIKNLQSPLSYANISIYEFVLTKWLETFIEKVQEQQEAIKSRHKMEAAIEYIAQNYNKDFNMAVVSNEVSMNYSLFSLAFKQYTGMNFVNYLREIRMQKAKEYLKDTDLRIGEISQNIGYDNEKHFMKTFKTLYGVSPTEYRKNLRLNH